MKIIVLIKQVPEMERVKFDTERGVINRKSAGVEINPFDLNALEAALQIKEELGAEVIALSMGPTRAEGVIKEAIARGADDGVLLTDRKFSGADTRATSYLLASAIEEIGNVDLVIAGEMTVDGDTAQVGPQTAEYLGLAHVAYVTKLKKIREDYLTVVSSVWDANYLKKLKYPGLITVTKDLNTPRLPLLKRKLEVREAEVEKWGIADFKTDLDHQDVGLKGSCTRVRKIEVPSLIEREGKIWTGDELTEAITEVAQICQEKDRMGE
ncbi:electron transfer flavoprotein subunit beta/FixA family protein [Natroniella sulfidigena]|uniref:electron transfer flavoprotein subunit beta/FixA family protein n=1 Tax=Natroniella sulfidigena TaxID=723921 RepID=UPI00200B674F|nr:electron transfer flavoprotein subunit beta/FixA family protein [Natroniella sulfidigena]MCK8816881.1 electron transfer flavoprotein subunit beta/FixA family protein [Natroniella sulfidigena]